MKLPGSATICLAARICPFDLSKMLPQRLGLGKIIHIQRSIPLRYDESKTRMDRSLKPQFDSYIGIDYSGAGHCETRTSSLRVCAAMQGRPPAAIAPSALASSQRKTSHNLKSEVNSKRKNWNRLEIYHWLCEYLEANSKVMIGVDHGFSFPTSYFERYKIKNWNQFLADFVEHWPTHKDKVTVNELRTNSKRAGDASEFRLAEKWTSSAKSVFHFDVQGAVAKSTHCGIPFLAQLRERYPQLHFWPFDGFAVPKNRSVIAEVYPSLFRNRYDRASRTVDQQDAYSVCRWLQETDRGHGLRRYLQPPLTDSEKAKAEIEGWILGVA